MVDGQVKTVTCKGRTLDMSFDDSYEIQRLHTDSYFKVQFGAINFTPSGIMNPCKIAKGMHARIYYYHIKGHPKEGKLISVELRKWVCRGGGGCPPGCVFPCIFCRMDTLTPSTTYIAKSGRYARPAQGSHAPYRRWARPPGIAEAVGQVHARHAPLHFPLT